MSEIAPPTPVPPPTLPTPQRLPILLAPPTLSELPPGTKLDVAVQQLLDAGQVRLTSILGDITLNAGRLAVKPGDNLLLQILGGSGQPQARLSLPDGTQIPNRAAAPQIPSSLGSATPTSVVPPPLQIGTTVQATLLQPLTLGPNQTILPSTTPTTPGNTSGGVLAGAAPTAGGATLPSIGAATTPDGVLRPTAPVPGPNATPNVNQTPTPSGPGTPAIGQSLPVGSLLTLKVIGIQVPTSTPESLIPPTTGGQISLAPTSVLNGVVTGRQGVTHTVAQTPAGAVSLPTSTPFPPGTELKFEIVRLTPATTDTNALTARGQGNIPAGSQTWPALDEAMSTLSEVAPGAHAQVMQNTMPRLDAQLTTNIIFFLAALRGGDIRTWMGDGPIRVLDRIRPDLSGRLRDDMVQMTRVNDDPASGEWRMLVMPFMNDGDIERIRMLMRNDENGEDDEKDKGGSRFVIDLNLSRLGHMQLDGLVGNQGKRLDLVVRSDTPLPSAMKTDIRELYTHAIEVTGLDGSVGFQAAPAHFIEITADHPPSGDSGDGVVV